MDKLFLKSRSGTLREPLISMINIMFGTTVLVFAVMAYIHSISRNRVYDGLAEINAVSSHLRSTIEASGEERLDAPMARLVEDGVINERFVVDGVVKNPWGGTFAVALDDAGYGILSRSIPSDGCAMIVASIGIEAGLAGITVNGKPVDIKSIDQARATAACTDAEMNDLVISFRKG